MATKQDVNQAQKSDQSWPSWLRPGPAGVSIAVMVQPNAKRSEVVGVHGDALKIKIAAPPVDGAATEALLGFIADRLGVRRQAVEIMRGATSRQKVVLVHAVTPEAIALALR